MAKKDRFLTSDCSSEKAKREDTFGHKTATISHRKRFVEWQAGHVTRQRPAVEHVLPVAYKVLIRAGVVVVPGQDAGAQLG